MNECVQDILAHRKPDDSILVAIDFDECAIEEHLSRRITEFFAHRAEISEENKMLHGSDAIRTLFAAYVGLSRSEFEAAIQEQVSQITWREGFLDTAAILTKPPYFFVFISSGLAEAVRTAAASAGMANFHVIGSEIDYGSDDLIRGAGAVIGDTEKAEAVGALIASGAFSRVITVGHSAGDVPLISSGTPGSRFSLRDKSEAMEAADHVLDTWSDLLKFL